MLNGILDFIAFPMAVTLLYAVVAAPILFLFSLDQRSPLPVVIREWVAAIHTVFLYAIAIGALRWICGLFP